MSVSQAEYVRQICAKYVPQEVMMAGSERLRRGFPEGEGVPRKDG
jgi:hypothetical protein